MKVGSKVEHVFTKDWLYVIDILRTDEGHDKVLCRTKQLEEIWFYDFELRQL